MACLIDQELTFSEGSSGGIPELSYDDSLDYSKYTAVVNNVEIPFYEVHYDGDNGHVAFTAGEGDNDYIAPSVVIDFSNEQDTYVEYYDADNQPFNGEITVSICEKESDSDACPDVPFSESAPEKYADYFDEDGNFVPKASSGGDCALSFAKLTLTTSDDKSNFYLANPKFSALAPAGSFPFISSDVIFIVTSSEVGVYDVPLYNGVGVVRFDLLNSSDSISIGEGSSIELVYSENQIRFYKITGDATLILPPDSGV